MMSKLPEIRVSSTKPTICFTGVDYIGSLLVKQKSNRGDVGPLIRVGPMTIVGFSLTSRRIFFSF